MKYLVAVALLATLAVVFGFAGTVAPVSEMVSPQQSSSSSSSSSSSTRFMYPPTYDSDWVDIRDKAGQYVTLSHGLNTTQVVVDITGKQSLDPEGGTRAWSRTYGGASSDHAWSVIQTVDGGYALAGHTLSFGAGNQDFWLVKTASNGNMQWNQTYGGANNDYASSVVQTGDGGYALAGYTWSFGAGLADFWRVKTDSAGALQWSQTYGGASNDYAYSMVQTGDGGYALAGYTRSYGAGDYDFWLVKTAAESGLVMTGLANYNIIMYRGKTDPYWNYVRVRMWLIQEPTWQYGDINQDGVVDAQDLFILSQNYGKTFSLLSLSGIAFIAGIHQYKRRKQPK